MKQEGFVYLDEAVEGAFWDAKYSGSDNFMGRPAAGYNANRVVLSLKAAKALKAAADEIRARGLGILVFDAYRPVRAVNDFVSWANDEGDTRRKNVHYPRLTKRQLIEEGYIAPKSSHSRGSAIDLTLCAPGGNPLDMGGIFDFMDPVSWHSSPLVTPGQTANRETLRRLMLSHGFEDYSREWWHYRLKDEPFPNTYFDFEID